MVTQCGFKTLDELIEMTIPDSIKRKEMNMGKYDKGFTESQFIVMLR